MLLYVQEIKVSAMRREATDNNLMLVGARSASNQSMHDHDKDTMTKMDSIHGPCLVIGEVR